MLEVNPGFDSISSHHLRSFPLSLGGRPTFLMTFLRQPEDVCISLLRQVQREFSSFPPEVRRHWPEDAPRLTLREFARQYLDPATASHDFAPQTRFLCNPNAAAQFGLSDGHEYGLDSYEMANSILKGFHFVGVVEEMKKSLEVLTDRLLQYGVEVHFDLNLKMTYARPEWLTPTDDVGRLVLETSKTDRLLHHHFHEETLKAHRALRKRRWLGFRPAAADARDALHSNWREAAQSLINSARLYRNARTEKPPQPITLSPGSDLLELRAARDLIAATPATESLPQPTVKRDP